uniref:ATP synthase F0 subunit 6 n=1 Tax=Augomonoctenus smithi TaxID=1519147 RepID=UPI0023F55A5A|nr:ATP synthase F0 subunit 6 [Augomonoctenus smithi]WDY84671.1 ATP synthase F0 subunit 6 [Augomonoctenus smithi]
MMMNLFSIFDPMSSFMPKYYLNWLTVTLGIFFYPMNFWLIMSRINMIWWIILKYIHMEIKKLMMNKNKGSTLMFLCLFMMILFVNFLGLLSYIFTGSSHLSFSLTLAFPMWLSFMIFGWMNNTNIMFIHLVPQSTPPTLMPFMVLIESISNFIRPITLSVRLTANMIAGHLLMTLLSSMSTYLSPSKTFIVIFIQITLLSLEFAVAIIQAYVFMVLMTLYSSEVN